MTDLTPEYLAGIRSAADRAILDDGLLTVVQRGGTFAVRSTQAAAPGAADDCDTVQTVTYTDTLGGAETIRTMLQAIPFLLDEIERLNRLMSAEDNVTDGLADALEYTSQAVARVTEERDRLATEVAELRANPRDDYHTMRELYEYRMLYNAHAVKGWVAAGVPVVKSWRHHDGELCFDGGWFIVTADLPTGQVSNHYQASAWGLFDCPEAVTAPEWDGHTPAEAADRLKFALDGES